MTGPESTGKTTLAARLAEWAESTWVPEASRLHAEEKGAPLTEADVALIARRQIALDHDASEQARAMGARLVVLDTDLLSTVVYARHYYGAVPAWVCRAERARRADLYLLCDVDVPWVADGLRDRPEQREEMHARFRDALARRRASVVHITGDWAARWRTAVEAVELLGR